MQKMMSNEQDEPELKPQLNLNTAITETTTSKNQTHMH